MRIGQLVLDVAPLRESRDFRWLYSGRLAASAGNVVAMTAASWQVYALTHSPFAVGLLTLTESIGLLVSLMAGGCWPTVTTGARCCWRPGCRRHCWPARSWPTACCATRRCGRSR